MIALAAEMLMGRDIDDDKEIAVWATVAAGATPSFEANLLAVLDTGRDAHLHLTRAAFQTIAVAGRARIGHDSTSTAALRTRLTEREEALVVVEYSPPSAT